jgi:hypothetical protein
MTINLYAGERKLYEHNIKIVAVERRVVGYFRNRENPARTRRRLSPILALL